jgi:hypothetical protein
VTVGHLSVVVLGDWYAITIGLWVLHLDRCWGHVHAQCLRRVGISKTWSDARHVEVVATCPLSEVCLLLQEWQAERADMSRTRTVLAQLIGLRLLHGDWASRDVR